MNDNQKSSIPQSVRADITFESGWNLTTQLNISCSLKGLDTLSLYKFVMSSVQVSRELNCEDMYRYAVGAMTNLGNCGST